MLSDFLVSPPPDAWLAAVSQGWDVVPVVIQDPTWEQSFPDVSGVTVPIADAESGRLRTIRLRRSQVASLREANEQRLRERVHELEALGAEPVVVGSTNEDTIVQGFFAWADRRTELSHAWQLIA